MEEKILNTKKNGMAIMLLCILLYVGAILCVVFGGINLDKGRMIGLALLVWRFFTFYLYLIVGVFSVILEKVIVKREQARQNTQ